MKEIRLYIEGAGESDEATKRRLRAGLRAFFGDIFTLGQQKKISFELIMCGNGSEAYKDFERALEVHPAAFNVLLIDADHAVSKGRIDHLKKQFKWSCEGFVEAQCHLMVQVMEAWFLADHEALVKFYGRDFLSNSLPKSKNVETIEKKTILDALKHTTSKCQKREYHKTKHAGELLKLISPAKVRKASHHCDCLFKTLEEQIQAVG